MDGTEVRTEMPQPVTTSKALTKYLFNKSGAFTLFALLIGKKLNFAHLYNSFRV